MEDEALDDFLIDNPNKKRTKREVFLWWESLRLRYNKICFGVGFFSILGIILTGKLPIQALGACLIVAILVAILGNLFYFLGWFVELFTNRNEKVGPILWHLGMAFSIIVLLLPLYMALRFF